MDKHFILLGSGLSALGFLQKEKKENFLVFDKNNYPGGHAYSHKLNGYYFDEGAHISHSKNNTFLDFVGKNKIDDTLTFKSNICNFKKNKKIGYPIQFHLNDLHLNEKLQIFKDAFQKPEIKINNYHDWLIVNYGKYLTEKYYTPYTKKYWRCSPNEMSCDWVSGRLPKKNILKTISSLVYKNTQNNMTYDLFRYPKNGGFFDLFKNKYSNFNINLNSKVTRINLKKKSIIINDEKEYYYEKLISTIPILDYLYLIPDLSSEIKSNLKKLKHTKLIAFNFKIKKKKFFNFQWCYFYDEDLEVSRMSILNNLNQKCNKDDFYIVQMEVFRRNDEKIDIDNINQNVKEHLLNFFNINESDIFFEEKILIDKAYPIPLLNSENIRLHTINYLKQYDIYQMGLYGKWKYMWSDQSFLDGLNYDYS